MTDKPQDDLARLRSTRSLIRRQAALFERYGGACKGTCVDPVVILKSIHGAETLTCCNLYPTYVRYKEMRAMERHMQAKANIGRPVVEKATQRPVEAPLGERYERTFTDTAIIRRRTKR